MVFLLISCSILPSLRNLGGCTVRCVFWVEFWSPSETSLFHLTSLRHILTTLLFSSRVHITQDVLDVINGDYEVEEGHGSERDVYLKEHDMKTYLVSEKHSKDRVS